MFAAKHLGRTIGAALLWTAVVLYVFYAASVARTRRRAAVVREVRVEVRDSTAQGSLVTEREVRGWIARSGLKLEGMPLDSVDLTALERLILQNGFVDRAAVYLSDDDVLHVELSQHTPVLRLLVDGMNSYATRDGHLFVAPPRSARYVPVVTGSYRPPVPTNFSGSLRDYIDQEKWKIDTLIASLERSKYPLYAAEREKARQERQVRRERIKKGWREHDEEFARRVQELRDYKAARIRKYRYEARLIRREIDGIGEEQERLRQRQKKLEKSCEDFMKLLTFVERVEKDDFWRSEIVQLIASTAPSGDLEVAFVPRSGRFTVRLGRLERVGEKLDKLLRFYDRGLSAIGWERYSVIDVRFADQVVCR